MSSRSRARNESRYTTLTMHSATVAVWLAQATPSPTPQPSPSPTLDPSVLEADPLTTIAAVIAIVLALAAAVIGYRVIRGGRGL